MLSKNKVLKKGKTMLYYDINKNLYVILKVKPGNNLSKKPYYLKDNLIVTKKMLRKPIVSFNKGLVSINILNLIKLKKYNSTNTKKLFTIFKNRKNIGFKIQ